MWREDNEKISNILNEIFYKSSGYSNHVEILEEGIDEKIPKILNLLPDKVRLDNKVHDLTDPKTKGVFIKFIANTYDPTSNASYITWILKLVKNGNIRGMEDQEKVYNSLKKFTELKNKPQFPAQYKDINRFKSFGDLAEVIDEHSNLKSKKEVVRIAREDGIELADEDGEYKLYIVTKSEAGAKHFRDTSWCVKDPRYFDQYGAPYYYFTKNDQPFTLLHLDSDQCMDVHDRDVRLNQTQKNMMETEEMTKYVVEHDNSESAMSNYSERVGEGFGYVIGEYVEKQLDALIDKYNFKHYNLYTDNIISEGYYSAGGFINYNFKNLEDYFDNRDFQKIVKNSLSHIDKYIDYISDDNFSEDGISFDIQYDSQSDYNSKGKLDQLKSFLNELEKYDKNYENDVENFEEHLTEKLLNAGYISSAWGTFKTKVLDNIVTDKYQNTFKRAESTSGDYVIEFDGYDDKIYDDNNYKLFSKFFNHVQQSINQIYIRNDSTYLTVTYSPEYDKNLTLNDYMRDFKIFKSFNVHYDDYQDQIDRFKHFLRDGSKTGDEEIPIFTLRSRKSPTEQGYFQFREQTETRFDKLYKKITKFI